MASVCPQCGSQTWRSDRSLAGRMVCGRCGTAQGVVGRRQRSSQTRTWTRGRLRWWGWLLLALAFLLVVQLL